MPLAVLYIDLNQFKAYNDVYGYEEGDRVLHRIGILASSMLRGSDVAGRMGGDEFAVLLLETDKHAGERFRRRLSDGLAELVERNELPSDFALSAGWAHYPTDAAEPDALLRLADARQYDIKRAKRN